MKKAGKKSKADTREAGKARDEKATKSLEKDEQNMEEGRMDFGGLPNRDLKKNLGGCG